MHSAKHGQERLKGRGRRVDLPDSQSNTSRAQDSFKT